MVLDDVELGVDPDEWAGWSLLTDEEQDEKLREAYQSYKERRAQATPAQLYAMDRHAIIERQRRLRQAVHSLGGFGAAPDVFIRFLHQNHTRMLRLRARYYQPQMSGNA